MHKNPTQCLEGVEVGTRLGWVGFSWFGLVCLFEVVTQGASTFSPSTSTWFCVNKATQLNSDAWKHFNPTSLLLSSIPSALRKPQKISESCERRN